MIAGLPKLGPIVLTLLLIACISIGVAAQETQTDSVVPEEILLLIDGNPLLDEAQREDLLSSLEAAIAVAPDLVNAGTLSSLLDTLGWSGLEDPEDLTEALALLRTVLDGTASGEIIDLEGALSSLLADEETPDGVLNAIGKAAVGAGLLAEETEGLLAKVTDLMGAGLPPGIVLRVTKDGLRDGLTAEELSVLLDELQTAIAAGMSAGNAANAVTGQGQNQYQDEEQNKNASEEEDPGTELEEESNRHGNGGSGKENAPGQNKEDGNQGGKKK